jgi:hypothetical protein
VNGHALLESEACGFDFAAGQFLGEYKG